MTEIDALAPGTAGRWTHENTAVEFSEHLAPGAVVLDRQHGSLSIRHRLSSTDIGEALVHRLTDMDLSQREFELVLVGLVRSTVTDPVEAWTTYYRNSLDDLLSGSADFAPVHQRAEALVRGSVLDLGSCFGFFPLRLAMAGIEVTATDLSRGTAFEFSWDQFLPICSDLRSVPLSFAVAAWACFCLLCLLTDFGDLSPIVLEEVRVPVSDGGQCPHPPARCNAGGWDCGRPRQRRVPAPALKRTGTLPILIAPPTPPPQRAGRSGGPRWRRCSGNWRAAP